MRACDIGAEFHQHPMLSSCFAATPCVHAAFEQCRPYRAVAAVAIAVVAVVDGRFAVDAYVDVADTAVVVISRDLVVFAAAAAAECLSLLLLFERGCMLAAVVELLLRLLLQVCCSYVCFGFCCCGWRCRFVAHGH